MANGDFLAEIDAGSLARDRASVFWHIEQGLHKCPHETAVRCMHQPANYLSSLVGVDNEQNNEDCLTLTYTQLHRTALNLAAGMIANRVQKGSTMLTLIPNGGEYTILLWMCVLMGLTLASVDPSTLDDGKSNELKDLIQQLKPGVVVVPNEAGARVVGRVAEDGCFEQPLRLLLNGDACNGSISMLSLVACVSNSSIDKNTLLDEARRNDPDRIHSILFTSGTSAGRPKGCPQRVASMTHVLQHLDWLINHSNCSHVLQQAHNSRAIAPAHTLQTWKYGGEVVMASASFAIGDTLEAILRHNVSFIVLSPAMVHALEYELIPHPSKTHSVRTVHLGGDVITKGVLAKSAALFPSARICISHGMTEGLGFFEWPLLDNPISQVPTFGEICPTGSVAAGSRLRIWDPDKKVVARRGKPGELHVCCASIIQHYLGGVGGPSFYEDEKGRWFITGDMAMMDEKGLVYILGRTKDAIKRANVTIMPAVLESCIEKYVDAQASVVAVPHPTDGHEPFAVLSNFNDKSSDEIRNHILNTFGGDYALGGILLLGQIGPDKFPVNATHKVVKYAVQEAVMKYLKRTT